MSRNIKLKFGIGTILAALIAAPAAVASAQEENADQIAITFLWIAVVLLAAKLSSLVEKWGQPLVLGELLIGVVLGNLTFIGLSFFEPITQNPIIAFLAELGVVILLFQIGLESNISHMRKVGGKALSVALIGMIMAFGLGTYLVGPLLLPGLDPIVYIFLGATLTATSVGITARVFRDLGKLNMPEAQIVLGAAVIEDVLGLIMLAVVTAAAKTGSVSLAEIGKIGGLAIIFLVGSIVIGQMLAPRLGRLLSKIHTGIGMKFTLAISFGLIFAYLAHILGLAPIVGAFAAGLILDPVHFKDFKDPEIVSDVREAVANESPALRNKVLKTIAPHADRHIDDIIQPVGLFLIPIFFVYTGMTVDLSTLFNAKIILAALGITLIAFIGKAIAGFGIIGKQKLNRWIIGFGMVPRGEIGFVFAAKGISLGIISDEMFSMIVIMVILTTFVTPIILAGMLKNR
ncbi:sodium:proton exchanger [Candidatus Peregrinibacteria bacterium CG11_big_fil_rev_8_21_14_0_20_46_8]|nr:MAG: sodium:proton exchanger [Candidatus Peregrinibacteria bacterium CG11_big_fil_rev_8_21_14_0_20_46_8]